MAGTRPQTCSRKTEVPKRSARSRGGAAAPCYATSLVLESSRELLPSARNRIWRGSFLPGGRVRKGNNSEVLLSLRRTNCHSLILFSRALGRAWHVLTASIPAASAPMVLSNFRNFGFSATKKKFKSIWPNGYSHRTLARPPWPESASRSEVPSFRRFAKSLFALAEARAGHGAGKEKAALCRILFQTLILGCTRISMPLTLCAGTACGMATARALQETAQADTLYVLLYMPQHALICLNAH